jgi:predicted SAM-dependent methyltransferase
MNYSFPFNPNCKVIELGGGTRPYFRPNLDVREAENVDIVADFNKPLPIEDNEYEGVFSSFCIEHISWRKVLPFLKECYRILKPGSKAVFLTANTEEQIKHVLNHDDWEDECSRILFGDQDYDENTHRNSLCPRYAIKLCIDAGFENVIIFPFGELKTDIIIEASKPLQPRNSMINFNHSFFDNPEYYGNSLEGTYRDHPKNWIAIEKILDKNPTSVLELGCARGYIIKKLESQGIKAVGVENSDHCILTRVTNNIIKHDITQTPWPFKDNEFDLCFSVGVLNFIPENKINSVISEIKRVSKNYLIGVGLEDNCHEKSAIKKSKQWWNEKLEEIISSDELFSGSLALSLPSGDGLTKLNLGSFTNMFYDGWINMDIVPLQEYANYWGYKFINHDFSKPLLYKDESVDLIYSSHMFEHLSKEEGMFLLKEAYRIMKSGSTLRMLVPDAEKIAGLYLNKQLGIFDIINVGCEKTPFQSGKLWELLFSGHKIAYDFEALKLMGEDAGFKVEKKNFNEGHEQILKETMDCLPEISLIVEFKKD